MAGIEIEKMIVAIVTLDMNSVLPGSAPVFYAKNNAEQERMALYLSRVLDAAIHSLDNGTYFLVKH